LWGARVRPGRIPTIDLRRRGRWPSRTQPQEWTYRSQNGDGGALVAHALARLRRLGWIDILRHFAPPSVRDASAAAKNGTLHFTAVWHANDLGLFYPIEPDHDVS